MFLLLLACSKGVVLPVESPATDSVSSSDDSGTSDDTGSDTQDPPVAQDYSVAGPYGSTSSSGSENLGGGCTMRFERYQPETGSPRGTVILSHGFARSSAQMAELGAHLASWGLDVITPDLCHASFLDPDHAQNGEDLTRLAAALGVDHPLYAGHSAGGLASLLAASQDPNAVAMLGLDPVDSSDLGVAAAGAVQVPALGIFGEPSTCNSSSNGVEMLAGVPAHQGLRVSEADHCDFEAPTDWICTAVCQGRNTDFSDDQISASIRGLATAAVLWQTGAAPEAEAWWTPGDPWFEAMASIGLVTAL